MRIEKRFRNKIDQTSKNVIPGKPDNSECYLIWFEDKKSELKIVEKRKIL